jgi:translation initiation factor IF-1
MNRDNISPPFMTANGIVLEALPGALFRVKLDEGREVLAYIAGRMRMNHIKVLVGDRVTVEFNAESDARGRITRRL